MTVCIKTEKSFIRRVPFHFIDFAAAAEVFDDDLRNACSGANFVDVAEHIVTELAEVDGVDLVQDEARLFAVFGFL